MRVFTTLVIGAGTIGLGYVMARIIISPDWTWVVTVSGVGTYLLTIAVNPLLGLLTWIVTAPFSRFYYLDIKLGHGIPDLTLTRICAGFMMALLAAQLAASRRRFLRITKVDVFILLFCAAMSFSLPMAAKGPKAAITLLADGYLIPFLIYFFARSLIVDRKGQRAALTGLFIIGAYLAVIAIREQITGEILFWFRDSSWYYQGGVRKLSGLLGNPAYFGTIFSMIIPFTIRAVLRTRNPSKKVLGLVLLGAQLLALFYTYNRGSWAGFIVGMLILLALYPRFRKLAIPIILAVALLVVLNWDSVTSSPIYKDRALNWRSVEYRLQVYTVLNRLIRGNLLFGLGMGNYEKVYLREVKGIYSATPSVIPIAPHNSFLYMLFAGGLTAMIPFTLLFLSFAYDQWIAWRRSTRRLVNIDPGFIACCLSAYGAYLVQSGVIDMITASYVNMIFFFIMGIFYGRWDGEYRKLKAARATSPANEEA